MIVEHLPRYLELHPGITYTTVRSIMIDGHEVAWMRLDGIVKVDLSGEGKEGQPWHTHSLYCECDFAEGVGWKIDTSDNPRFDGRPTGIYGGKERCLYRRAACHLRHLELQREYVERYDPAAWNNPTYVLLPHFSEIVFDLIERVKADEFIGEDGNGASFWAGYFYLGTLAEILGQFVGHLWPKVYAMVAAKEIGLDGAVIQEYTEPPPPEWVEYSRLEVDGWLGIASLPGNRQMAREWKLEILKPDGTPAYAFVPGEGLDHDPVFGPDVDDIANVERRLNELITQARKE